MSYELTPQDEKPKKPAKRPAMKWRDAPPCDGLYLIADGPVMKTRDIFGFKSDPGGLRYFGPIPEDE
jgi:hypothetical protein